MNSLQHHKSPTTQCNGSLISIDQHVVELSKRWLVNGIFTVKTFISNNGGNDFQLWLFASIPSLPIELKMCPDERETRTIANEQEGSVEEKWEERRISMFGVACNWISSWRKIWLRGGWVNQNSKLGGSQSPNKQNFSREFVFAELFLTQFQFCS